MARLDGPVLVWRLGGNLLAVDLEFVEEILPVDDTGGVHGRAGALEVLEASVLDATGEPSLAVVVRDTGGQAGPDEAGPRRLALPAEQVDGVIHAHQAAGLPGPEWMADICAPRITSLVLLDNGRIAALLNLAELFPTR
jgi:chemotaxis signal transduction protein